jgi:hypothetical protein
MSPQEETITPSGWLSDTSVGESARKGRTFVLGLYAKVNGRSTADEVVADIKAGVKTITETSRVLVDTLRQKGLRPSTVAQYRSLLPNFFQSVLGEKNFDRTSFDRLVPVGDNYTTTEKKAPTRPEFEQIVRDLANPRDRAFCLRYS